MSSIITNTLLTNYPVAGVDNDSQGFRDNFLRIKTALDQAKSELEVFESRSLLKSTLDNSPVPVINDINGSGIVNGYHNKFYGTSYVAQTITTNAADINLYLGTLHQLTLSSDNTVLTFVNWPPSGQYAKVRIHLTVVATNQTGITVSGMSSQNAGHVIKDISFPTTLNVTKDSFLVIEAWSYDHGGNVYVRYLGKYMKP
jgi:hypothetical protein